MKRSHVFTDQQLTEIFKRASLGEKLYVVRIDGGEASNKAEQNRVYQAASFAGRQIAMRKFREGWKATVIE